MLCALLSKGISLRRGSRALRSGGLVGRERQILLHQLPPPDAETEPSGTLHPCSSGGAWGRGAPTLQWLWG